MTRQGRIPPPLVLAESNLVTGVGTRRAFSSVPTIASDGAGPGLHMDGNTVLPARRRSVPDVPSVSTYNIVDFDNRD